MLRADARNATRAAADPDNNARHVHLGVQQVSKVVPAILSASLFPATPPRAIYRLVRLALRKSGNSRSKK